MDLIFNYDEELLEDFSEEQEALENILVEMYVDPGYELEHLDDVDRFYLQKVRERFAVRKEEYISYGDLRAAIYQIGNQFPKRNRMYNFGIIHMIRRWWRAGELRRFVKGRTRKKVPGRGAWHGVHYKLYPQRRI